MRPHTRWYAETVGLTPWLSVGRLDVRLEFKAADLWVGFYFHHVVFQRVATLHAWLCLLPCFPIRIVWHPQRPTQGGAR